MAFASAKRRQEALMKVLYVTSVYKPAYVYGGPARSVPALCEGMAQAGASVTVYTTDANGSSRLDVPLARPLNIASVCVNYFPLTSHTFLYSRSLASECRRHVSKFDIVEIDSLFAHTLGPAAQACTKADIPYVVPLRGQLLPWAFGQKSLKKRIYLSLFGRRLLNGAASLHCTDKAEAEAANQLGLRSPTFVTPNGIQTSRFRQLPPRGAWRRRLGIPSHALVLLFLGRLHKKKRPDIAVETLAACRHLPNPVHLLLAGGDEQGLTGTLESKAEKLDCSARLHCLGHLAGRERDAAFADSDLFLMPSEPDSENFGLSALEAMAAGLPVLVSDGVPIGRAAVRAGAGRQVSCDPQVFGAAATALLEKSRELKVIGRRAKALAHSDYDSTVIAEQMLGRYQAIVSSRRLFQVAR